LSAAVFFAFFHFFHFLGRKKNNFFPSNNDVAQQMQISSESLFKTTKHKFKTNSILLGQKKENKMSNIFRK
jgi:hypothetical protein